MNCYEIETRTPSGTRLKAEVGKNPLTIYWGFPIFQPFHI